MLLLAGLTVTQANWIAYNDHASGSGTHPNATRFHMLGLESGTNGLLKDVYFGTNLPVTLTLTPAGATGQQLVGMEPATGTSLHELFHGYVDFGSASANNVGSGSGGSVTFRISGLDPSRRYWLHLGAVVGRDIFTNRWTLLQLEGADDFTNVHSAGILDHVAVPELAPNQAAANFGANHTFQSGDVVSWRGIDPGPDGVIVIVSTRYSGTVPGGSSLGTAGYHPTGLRLREDRLYPPLIVSQPTDRTNRLGEDAVFEVQALGDDLNYQWHRDGTPIDNATNATLILPGIHWDDYGTVVSVQISNGAGVVWSEPAALRPLTPAIVIDTQPTDLTRFVGEDAVFQVEATGDELFYQWYRDDQPLADATNAAFVLPSVQWSDQGATFTVRLSNVLATVWSSNATLTVVIPTQNLVEVSAEWRYLPATNSTWAGWTEPDLDDSDWLAGNAPLGFASNLPVPIETVLPNQERRTHLFRIEFDHTFPTDSDLFAPVLRHLIDDGAVFYLNGREIYRYQMPVEPVDFETMAFPVETAEFASVVLLSAPFRQGRNVLAVEVHQTGQVPDADLVMATELQAVYQPHQPLVFVEEPQDETVMQYFLVTLRAVAEGFGGSYQWYKDGLPVPGAEDATLFLPHSEVEDSGLYHVIVSNRVSQITSRSARVTVIAGRPPVITQQPSDVILNVGQRGGVSVGTDGDPPFHYCWFKDQRPALQAGIPEFLPSPVFAQVATRNMAGQYHVEVTNLYGKVISQTATIEILPHPNPRGAPGSVDLDFYANYTDGDPNGLVSVGPGRIIYSGYRGHPLVKVMWDGFVDPDWNIVDTLQVDLPQPGPFTGKPTPWAVYPDGSLVVQVAQEQRQGFLRYLPDGSLDRFFEVPILGYAYDMEPTPDGGFLILIDHSLLRFDSDGRQDLTFDVGTGPDGPLSDIKVQPDGRILVGGGFTSFNGIPHAGLVRLHPNGTVDETFTAQLPGDDFQRTIELWGDRVVVIGQMCPDSLSFGIQRLLNDGSLDPTFQGGPCRFYLEAISCVVYPDGRIMVGGYFWEVDGQPISGLVRLQVDGSIDPTFRTAMSLGRIATRLALEPNGDILVGGYLGFTNGPRRLHLARLVGQPDPELTIHQEPNEEVVVSWPTQAQAFVLQSRDSLESGQWQSNASPPVPNEDRFTVRYPTTEPRKFFRLVYPDRF